MTTKYIFFTGGVVSSVGKGVTAAAVGRLLKERGFEVGVQCQAVVEAVIRSIEEERWVNLSEMI